jgi:hypothetical protein
VLQDVVDHLSGVERFPLSPSELRRLVASVLDGDPELADSIVRPLLALNHLVRNRSTDVDSVIEGLSQAVDRLEQWTPEQKGSWHAIESPLRALFLCDAVRMVSKATELSYDYANLFQGARIFTDVRPVFNDEEEDKLDIDAAVISYTLRLHFDNRDGNHSLSIALDEDDIRTIQKQCDRALRKSQVTRRRVCQAANIPSVIFGEKTDDTD